MRTYLPQLSWWAGISCAAIGLYHFVFGVRSVPGEQDANATVDSRERSYAAVFAGYGLSWIWASRQRPVPDDAVNALAATLLAMGVGRVVSMADKGKPHWFQSVLAVVEFAVPPIFFAATRRTTPPDPSSAA